MSEMKDILKIILIQYLLIVKVHCDVPYEDSLNVEIIESEGNNDTYYNLNSRTGKFISYIEKPVLSKLRDTIANNAQRYNFKDNFNIFRDQYPLPSEQLQEYDYVIIGAGSAGSVIASRLSENRKYSVLLLEAGGTESILTDIPLLVASFQHTDYNWGFRQERREDMFLAMDDQQSHWPRGKAVGGTSVINYMLYTRGNKIDWDRIAAAGNSGWSYDDVFPYFLKSERANLKKLENSKYHNKSGLLSIEDVPFRTRLADAFLEAGTEFGLKIADYNEGEQLNRISYMQAHTLNGKRHSTAKAFLHPFKTRKNLHILPNSRVTKINIDKISKTARSVSYVRNRKNFNVKARKEIILSAGTLGSPQILMLSGIGPKNHLNELGIEVIMDLKVGETMYDHFSYIGLTYLLNQTGIGFNESSVLTLKNALDWMQHGEGIITMLGGVEGIAYIKTKISEEKENYPDIELLHFTGCLSMDESNTVRKSIIMSDWFYDAVYKNITEKECFTIIPLLMHPKSKGHMKLKSKNPFHHPKFYYNYLSDRRDLDTLIEGIKYAVKLSESTAYKKYGAKMHDVHFPTCKQFVYGSDEYWECAIRTLGVTLHHQIATCKMGPLTDPEAVVDNELKVHGVNRLRVADASIIPIPLSAHTNAPTIMIGEKVSDIIKDTWK